MNGEALLNKAMTGGKPIDKNLKEWEKRAVSPARK